MTDHQNTENNTIPNEIFSFRGDYVSHPILIPNLNQNNNQGVLNSNQNDVHQDISMNNNENQNQHLVEEEDQDDELEEVSVLLCKIIKTHSNFQILFIFILCHVLYDFDFLYIIYISFANDVVNLVFYANKLRLSKSKQKLLTRVALNMFEALSLIIYKGCLIFHLHTESLMFFLPLIFIYGHFLLQFGFVLYNKIKRERNVLTEGIELVYRLFLCTQAGMISIKLDKLLDWEWKDVFWCYWVFFSIMIGVTLGFAIIFLGKLYQKCIESVESYELKGLFWLFYLSEGISINSAIIINCLVDTYDENEKKKLDNFFFQLIVICVYVLFLVLYSIILRKDLICFLEKIGTEEEDEDDEEEEEEEEEDQKKKKAKKIKVEKNPLKFYFPTFLSKTSSTYFKTVNTSFLQKLSKTQRKKSSNVNVKKKVSRQAKSQSFMLSPIKKVDSASGIVSPNLSPFAQILNIFQKKKEGEMTRFTDEGKEDSARQNLTENRAKEFERKKLDFNNRFAIEEELPHFGTKEEKLKSQIINTQPDLFMNKSFHVNLENRIQTQPNFEQEMKIEKSIIEDKSVLVDQTVNSCLICFDKTPNAVFMDCGHGGVCYDCATDIFKKTGECYLCRMAIKQVLELDLNEKNGDLVKVKASARLVTCEDGDISKIEESSYN